MNVQKFTAATSRDALRKVREALGPDAVILSNRPVDGVVEILALGNEDVASISAPAHGTEMAQARPHLQFAPEPVSVPAKAAAPLATPAAAPAAPAPAAAPVAQVVASQFAQPKAAPGNADMSEMMAQAIAQAKASATAEMAGMMNEIRAMRGLMETQLAELSWSSTQQREPQKATVLREMLAAGFSASLARYLIDKLPAGKDAADSLRWIKTVLSRNLTTMSNEDAIIEQGGVFALVGPTGVGKTTSTAKLAARCVMRHGPEKLALITTDAYRIGGHEQMVAAQVAMLANAGTDVKRLLCLNATATNETLNEVVRAYQGSGLAGAIMTKLDEAASIGNVLDVVIRQKLNLFYVSSGQRVPEDLHLAGNANLIERAFELKRDDVPTQYADAELPLLMASAGGNSLREVSLG
jgi:flagellar biosynthesis protein FlhF